MAGGKFWTDQEDELVRNLWPRASRNILLDALPNRTYESIRQRARHLSVKRCLRPEDRFDNFIDRDGQPPCHIFTGCIDSGGYGQFTIGGKPILAHRFAYEYGHGAIPPNMQIDHLCRVRSCVNPDHLEVVTPRENALRGQTLAAENAAKMQCPYGHALNRRWQSKRYCSMCRRHRHLLKRMYEAVDAGLVSVQESDDLALFKYTQECVHDNGWTRTTRMARGIVFDKASGVILCKGYDKFFNMGERTETEFNAIDWDQPYDIYEKMDGSLIYIWHYNDQWRTSTNGAFASEQAVAAKEMLNKYDISKLPVGCTILCELIHPDFRIVLDYGQREELVLLSVIKPDWSEYTRLECDNLATECGFSRPRIYDRFDTFSENEEGYVLHWPATNFRVKVKSPKYVRIHRLLEYVSPKRVLSILRGRDEQGEDWNSVRAELPDHILDEFDDISGMLRQRHDKLIDTAIDKFYRVKPDPAYSSASDRKTQALWIQKNVPKEIRGLVFSLLDGKDISESAWKIVQRELREGLDG